MSRIATPGVAPRFQPAARCRAALLVAACALSACGGASGLRIEKLGGGVYKLHCDASLSACLQRADTLCRGASFDVLRAQDRRDRLGGEVGTSNVENRTSSAHIRCTTTGRRLLPWEDEEDDTQWKLGPRRDGDTPSPDVAQPTPLVAPAPAPTAPPAASGTAPTPSAPPAPSAPPTFPTSSKPAATSSTCVPGATQACVGPAACSGGQSCLPDGSGFGPCDCGAQSPQPLKSSKPALP
jgi:hypothetical protein